MIARLVSEHHYTMRQINITPSTPGDMTFSQLPISVLFVTERELNAEQMNRVQALLNKARFVVLLVNCAKDGRLWEHIQLFTLLRGLSNTVVLSATTPTEASVVLTSYIASYIQTVPTPALADPRESSEELGYTAMRDDCLRPLYEAWCESSGLLSAELDQEMLNEEVMDRYVDYPAQTSWLPYLDHTFEVLATTARIHLQLVRQNLRALVQPSSWLKAILTHTSEILSL